MNQHGLLHFGGFIIDVNLALLIMLVAIAAWCDIKSRRIPNRLVLAGMISSLGLQIFSGDGGFSAWGLGLLVGFGAFFPLYLMRAMGAGDVKLMAMVGGFLGPVSILGAVLMTFVAGGILAIAVAARSGLLRSTLANVRFMMLHTMVKTMSGQGARFEVPPASTAGKLPYALAIAAGTFIHLFLARSGHALFA